MVEYEFSAVWQRDVCRAVEPYAEGFRRHLTVEVGDPVIGIGRAADVGNDRRHRAFEFRDDSAGFIDELHEMGIKVSLWTVDMEDTVRSLLRTSADAYITNRPDRVREWMEKEQAATASGK